MAPGELALDYPQRVFITTPPPSVSIWTIPSAGPYICMLLSFGLLIGGYYGGLDLCPYYPQSESRLVGARSGNPGYRAAPTAHPPSWWELFSVFRVLRHLRRQRCFNGLKVVISSVYGHDKYDASEFVFMNEHNQIGHRWRMQRRTVEPELSN
ncbi:hypothetical protein B0H14DRAFT_2637817 [Mycena olivaceomarginata]|nr:hypothetical protein B0H14DRAFT_2637817 [Mycena olivaceomarginata]